MIQLRHTVRFVVLGLLVCASLTSAQTDEFDVDAIVKQIDELYRSNSSYARVEMQIVTPHWERTLALEAWTKGKDKTFILISAPKKEKGTATLRIGNEMWNYLPKVDKVMKIPPSMMMGSWMGSDFTNDDLVHEFSLLEDYTYRLISPEDAEPDALYLELIPKEGRPIVWGKVLIAVREVDYLPIWQKYYDEKGRLMRVMRFSEIKSLGKRKVPSVMELLPQNKQGHKTAIRYLDIAFDTKIKESVFSLRNLRKKR